MNAVSQPLEVAIGWWQRTFGRRAARAFDIDGASRSFSIAAERMLGMTPFDTQLQAARLLAQGRAVEMQTGEGKSLAVAAAASAVARSGRQVHVATVNRYLAERDFRTFAPVLRSLGLTVGWIGDDASPAAKLEAYRSQIVYATGYDLGFDYLREQQRVARREAARLGVDLLGRLAGDGERDAIPMPLDFVILDEADSVLLDEATVPLLLGELTSHDVVDSDAIALAAEVAALLQLGTDYHLDRSRRTIALTAAGRAAAERRASAQPQLTLLRPWRQYVEHALVAERLLRRDVDYVTEGNRLLFVDPTTGRIFGDRRRPDGLQQALEFKERLPLSPPNVGTASITRARFFRSYKTMAGISGTLQEAGSELRSTYGLIVDSVAPRLSSQFVAWPTRCFATAEARRRAVAEEADALRRAGRPVLVGCRTIAESTATSVVFGEQAIPHRVLDGRQTETEALIVAEAGRSGIVTIATNMAGRGTDIRLDDAARRSGGLHVIGVERNDSPRIDRQLLGRAGRQGDPGTGRFFVAATDALIAERPKLIADLVAAGDERGEVHGDFSAGWKECVRAAEQLAHRRRADAERAEIRRAAATATLLK